MLKQTQYNIADSNIANLGSDLEKKVKLEASQHEEAWRGAGKVEGDEIWRIEQFKIHAWPKAQYGQFYSGDSYIILHTYKKKPDSPALSYDVHFWLGKFTSQDEAGTAAYKTVELDDFLGGAPVQYREVMGHESKRFLSYFPHGIRLLEGGIDSGFKHVKPEEYRPRLLQLKGKKLVRVHEVPLTYKSLNSGDVFIADGGREIIQWNGSKCAIFEKSKAATLLIAMEEERNGHAKGRVISEGDDDEAFWKYLGGKGPIAPAEAGGADDAAAADPEHILLKLIDQGGKITFAEVGKGHKLKKALFDTKEVFIVDSGEEVIVWVGKLAPIAEKRKSLQFAQEYVTAHHKPITTSISRCLEGGENPVLESYLI